MATSDDIESATESNSAHQITKTGSNNDSLMSCQWKLITKPFFKACSGLELGELVHDDFFGLFEAMSAIEMMDPKMDAGMRCNNPHLGKTGAKGQPYNFQTGLEAGHLPMKEDTPYGQIIGIIDETISCFVTWLEGHSLAQTVFTNLYLHSPSEIAHPSLRAFSVVTLKLVEIVKDFIAKGSVYEEEDFQPCTYGFKLDCGVSEQRAGGMLREVEDDLQRVIRATKQDETKKKENLHATGLYSRIKFLRFFFAGLNSLYKVEIQEGNKFLSLAKDLLPAITATLNVGYKPAGSENMLGFEPFANQRLLPPTFPRYTEICSRESSYTYLKELIERLISSTNVVNHSQSFHSALEFFIEYSFSSPCVLSRSILQSLYQPLHIFHASGGTASGRLGLNVPGAGSATPFQDQLREDCKAFLAPPALTLHKSPPYNAKAIKDYIANFFNQCCRPMCLLVQTYGHNKARQRDKIPSLLEELAITQEEADKLDTMLTAVAATNAQQGQGSTTSGSNSSMLYLSTWLLYYVLRLMIRYILSGFELELFSSHEYPYMYWYLYELLYPWLTTCLHRADSCLMDYENYQESQKSGKTKKKTKSKKKPQRPHAKEITLYQGYAAMCSGFFKLSVSLRKDKKIVIPNTDFDSESVRYEHRFAPFNNLLTPPAMPYGQFLEVYNVTTKTESAMLYLNAARDFGRARQVFESFAASAGQSNSNASEMSSLATVSKTNMVATSILSKDSSRKVEFDFSTHLTFPIVKFC